MPISRNSHAQQPADAPDALREDNIRRRIEVRGRVQGVGFRPFVANLASEMNLTGFVGNDPRGAFIEVEGAAGQMDGFQQRLLAELPPLARITDLQRTVIAPTGATTFEIAHSDNAGPQQAYIAPDCATCDDCLKELFDPSDRRSGYPFINCTNCGPRYSIIRDIPYDRSNTTMARFRMCPSCSREYHDPTDRRYHAQPNACPVCGPYIWLEDDTGEEIRGNAIELISHWLQCGAIAAIKGLGGFHLACRADHDGAVNRLRDRKQRESKPFAVMVPDVNAARKIVCLDQQAIDLLTSPAHPIVLAPKQPDARVSELVAPGNPDLGVMLPYTPLHHLIFVQLQCPLVMTSANPSDEPLCCRNHEARERLAGIADVFLMHNRDIERRVDDSVVRVMPNVASDPSNTSSLLPIRRARGFVPDPIMLDQPAPEPILALGGELKSTVCLLAGSDAVMSEHLGELSNPVTYRNFVQTIDCLRTLLDVSPEVVACDMHPGYASVRYARQSGLRTVEVQHHHAHVAAIMAEAGWRSGVLGVSCDGTGFGTDGMVWGCELLACNGADFERVGHLRYFPLSGGDLAATQTWRPAAGLAFETYGTNWPRAVEAAFAGVDPRALAITRERFVGSNGGMMTSSLGRLFDAAAFFLGLSYENWHEAQAAMALEQAACATDTAKPLEYRLEKQDDGHGAAKMLLDIQPAMASLIERRASGDSVNQLAACFHETLVAMLSDAVLQLCDEMGMQRVALTGGCFANRLLLSGMMQRITAAGLDVRCHQKVPTGDGGIALGQAWLAAEKLRGA